MMKVLVALLLAGCAGVQVPGQPRCGSVPVASNLDVTAFHCLPLAPRPISVVAVDKNADLMLYERGAARPAKLGDLPSPGDVGTVRGFEFEVVDVVKYGRDSFIVAHPPLDPGMSGSGLWIDGRVSGIAIRNHGDFAYFVSAESVARMLELQ